MNILPKKPLQQLEIHNILLWMPNWIGDVILTMPTVHSLRKRYPGAKIAAVVKSPSDELLRAHPEIDTVIRFPVNGWAKEKTQWRFALNLRKYRFDLGVVFPNSIRTGLLLYLSGARRRLGYKTEGRACFLTDPIPVTQNLKKTAYRVDYFFNVFSPLELDPPEKKFVPLKEENLSEVEAFLERVRGGKNRAFITLHPGTSKPERSWHAERFGILSQILIKDFGVHIVLLGNQKERALLEKIQRFCPEGTAFLAPSLTLATLAALIRQSRLFIGNDSGMMHLAAMAGAPVVGIFGPGDPNTTGPYLPEGKCEIVTKNYPCSPCRQRFFKDCKPSVHNKPFCLEDISVQDVAKTVQKLWI